MESLKKKIIESAINSLQSINNKINVLMIMSICLSLGVISLMIPIFAYIQNQREEVLKLFATI